MKQYIAIFIGGALGALLRFEMSAHIHSGTFPVPLSSKTRREAFYSVLLRVISSFGLNALF